MITPKEVVQLLYKAKCLKLPMDDVTPSAMEVTLNKHDTATQCHIHLTSADKPPLLIWYKTNWCHPSYEFNERGKTTGLQPGCGFVLPMLDEFFMAVKKLVDDAEQAIKNADAAREIAQDQERKALIDVYQEEWRKARDQRG